MNAAPASALDEPASSEAEPARSELPRVLFVAFQTGRRANGGIRSLSEILAHLRRVRPILLTQTESDVTARWRAAGYEVHVWPFPWPRSDASLARSRGRRILGDVAPLLSGNVRMARLLRARGIRVVHCNDGWASMVAGPAARAVGCRVVLNIRDTLLNGLERWKVMRSLSDRVIVLSEEMRDEVARRLAPSSWMLGCKTTPVSAIYSIVDTRTLRPASAEQRARLRAKLGMTAGEVAIGVVGALVPKKQQLELIRYLNAHPEQLPPAARLYFVGDFEPARDAYCRECQLALDAGPVRDRVRFVGYSGDVTSWYQALDLTLLVSRFEGLARAMIESVSCGTPVAAFDFCSAREILERQGCGLVAPQGDYAQLLRCVSTLIEDGEQRQALALRGPAVASELFAPRRVAERYEDVYLELGA